MAQFYVVSVKHRNPPISPLIWWGPNRRGYFEQLRNAGKYSEKDADAIVDGGKYPTPSSVKVPIEVADSLEYAGTVLNTENVIIRLGALDAWRARS